MQKKMPDDWKLKEIMPSKRVENTKIEQIIQDEDGNVTLKMKRTQSMAKSSTIAVKLKIFEQLARRSIDDI